MVVRGAMARERRRKAEVRQRLEEEQSKRRRGLREMEVPEVKEKKEYVVNSVASDMLFSNNYFQLVNLTSTTDAWVENATDSVQEVKKEEEV